MTIKDNKAIDIGSIAGSSSYPSDGTVPSAPPEPEIPVEASYGTTTSGGTFSAPPVASYSTSTYPEPKADTMAASSPPVAQASMVTKQSEYASTTAAPAGATPATYATANTTSPTTPVSTTAAPVSALRRSPQSMRCPYCAQNMMTKTRLQPSILQVISFIVVLVLFWPLCWLPFVIPSCYMMNHFCPMCNRKVGSADVCTE